jgi:iron complex outermembrane receptor protein
LRKTGKIKERGLLMKSLVMASTIFSLLFLTLPSYSQESPQGGDQVRVEKTEQKAEKPVEQAEKKTGKQKAIRVVGKELPAYNRFSGTKSAELATEVIDSEEIDNLNPVDFYDTFSRGAGTTESFQGRKNMNFAGVRRGGSMAIIVDGLYIPASQASRIMAQFPMDAVESIRIVRDSTSLSLGPVKGFGSLNSAANEGVVVITTKKSYRTEVGGSTKYGSYTTLGNQLYFGTKMGNFDIRLTGSNGRTEGKEDWHNDSSSRSFLLTAGFNNSFLKVNGMFYFSDGRRNFQYSYQDVTTLNQTNLQVWCYNPLQAYWSVINTDLLWNSNQITSFTIGHGFVKDTEHLDKYNEVTKVYTASPDKLQSDQTDDFHLWHTSIIGNNIMKLGTQYTRWHEPTGYASNDGINLKETLYSAYAQDEHKFMDGRLTFDVGARVDLVYVTHGVDYATMGGGYSTCQQVEGEWLEPTYGASAGSAFILNDIFTVNARLGYTQTEMSSQYTVDNKDLPSEKRFKYEAGVAAKLLAALNATVTGFYYDVNDAKVVAATADVDGDTINDNIYDAKNMAYFGTELGVNGILPLGFNYKVNYTFADQKDWDNSNPKYSTSASLGNVLGPVETNVSLRYVSSYNNNNVYPNQTCGDFYKIDGNIAYNFSIMDELTGRVRAYVRNAMDTKYTTTSRNYEDMGRTYGVELSANVAL